MWPSEGTDTSVWGSAAGTLSADGAYAIFASDWAYGNATDSCTDSDLGRGDPYLVEIDASGTPLRDIPFPIFWRE